MPQNTNNKKIHLPRADRFFSVEPRRIALLYPSVDHGFLTRGGPLNSTKLTVSVIKTKKARDKARTFRVTIESVVDSISIANQQNMSTATRYQNLEIRK